MNIHGATQDVAAPAATPASSIADGGAFANSLVEAADRSEPATARAAVDREPSEEDEPGHGAQAEASLAGLVTSTAQPVLDREALPGDRLLTQRGRISRTRATTAATIALARVGELTDAPTNATEEVPLELDAGVAPSVQSAPGAVPDATVIAEGTVTGVDAADGDSADVGAPADRSRPHGAVAAIAARTSDLQDADPTSEALTSIETSAPDPVTGIAADTREPVSAPPSTTAAATAATVDEIASPVPEAAPSSTTSAAAADARSNAVAARVEAAVEALRNAPPPRQATIEVEGMRLLVRLTGDVVQVVPDQVVPPAWQRELGSALADRGLHLGQQGSGDPTADDQRPDPEQPHGEPRARTDASTTTTIPTGPGGRGDSVLL